MATLIHAGIGARATPGPVLADMKTMAGWLARTGWHLASGGAAGADTAFAVEAPAGGRTLYLPWRGYNGHGGPDCRVLSRVELSACMTYRRPTASRLEPLLSGRAEVARKERGRAPGPRARPSRRCGGVLERRRRRHRRHGDRAAHCGRTRDSCAEPRRPLPRATCERLLAIRRAS